MSRTGIFIAALLLLAGGRAFAFQTPGAVQAKQLSAAAMAAQQAKKPSAAAAGQHYNPVQQTPTVCIEGPDCAASNATASQANSAGNIETNAQGSAAGNTASNVTNAVTDETTAGNISLQGNTSGTGNTDGGDNKTVVIHPTGGNLPLIIGTLVVLVILAGTAGFAVHRHNILVTTRGLLSLRTKLVQPSAPSDHPEMKFEWPPLSIRTRLEEGITDDG